MKSTIESLQADVEVIPPPGWWRKARVRSMDEYQRLYAESVEDPAGFWGGIAEEFTWFRKWDRVCAYDFNNAIQIEFFKGGKTNITVNAIDRHIEAGRGAQVAYYWEGNEPGERRIVTYRDLFEMVCRLANVLKAHGVKKGDRVTIYMPQVPELAAALLACARIGAVHSVICGGFSAQSIKERILDARSDFVITADATYRGSKHIPLKKIMDEAMEGAAAASQPIRGCLVYPHTRENVPMQPGRDLAWETEMRNAAVLCTPEVMDAEDPLLILYTSGSTGKPKGVLHTTAGYMVYTTTTFQYGFDYRPGDIYWCTADIGWITGHSYVVYGPLCAGATSVMFDGVPNHPGPDRFWEICARYQVNQFYTAPTAIRALMREGDQWPARHNLKQLRILGTVGEPINPEAWKWYHRSVGGGRCPIVDTYWQTETGGFLITPLPGAFPLKPGSATFPFFGVEPRILREDGSACAVNEGGYLVIAKPWPGMMRTVYGAHQRFKETYFTKFHGMYFTGDGARRDEDGYIWLMGRVDDVINVSGHRIGTAEVESALVAHAAVAEAAVVGAPHAIKGECLVAFVTLKATILASEEIRKQLVEHVRREIGPIATPERIQFADALPKTRSGKIMRRILRKIAAGDTDNLGDITTLADPTIVERLIGERG